MADTTSPQRWTPPTSSPPLSPATSPTKSHSQMKSETSLEMATNRGMPTIARPFYVQAPNSELQIPPVWPQQLMNQVIARQLREIWGKGNRRTLPVSFRSKLRRFASSEFDVRIGNQAEYELPLCCNYSHVANNGMLLAVGDEEGYITIFDTTKDNRSEQDVKRRWVAHPNAVFDLAWTPCDRKLITASGDRTARVFDVETSQTTFLLQLEETE
ncbi:hypothetical protein HK096_011062 [Nowakowskiella sp. JEL0078]|nr:hypothetical protein HK096_011062 [Nowakowskiella sp. JEL0078]